MLIGNFNRRYTIFYVFWPFTYLRYTQSHQLKVNEKEMDETQKQHLRKVNSIVVINCDCLPFFITKDNMEAQKLIEKLEKQVQELQHQVCESQNYL